VTLLAHRHHYAHQEGERAALGARYDVFVCGGCGDRKEWTKGFIEGGHPPGSPGSFTRGNVAARIARHKVWDKQMTGVL
jgi:hypothetical protein